MNYMMGMHKCNLCMYSKIKYLMFIKYKNEELHNGPMGMHKCNLCIYSKIKYLMFFIKNKKHEEFHGVIEK